MNLVQFKLSFETRTGYRNRPLPRVKKFGPLVEIGLLSPDSCRSCQANAALGSRGFTLETDRRLYRTAFANDFSTSRRYFRIECTLELPKDIKKHERLMNNGGRFFEGWKGLRNDLWRYKKRSLTEQLGEACVPFPAPLPGYPLSSCTSAELNSVSPGKNHCTKIL